MNPLPIVLADLRRTIWGALAVVLLVALSVGLGVAVSAQERALRAGSASAADPFDILIGAPGSETQLVLSSVYLQPASLELIDGAVLAELQATEGIRFVSPLGFGDSWRGHPIVGVAPPLLTALAGARPIEGRPFEAIDEAVVGARVPLEVGQTFEPVHGQIVAAEDEAGQAHEGFPHETVGRLPPLGSPWDDAILVPIEAVWWIHGLPVGHAPPAAGGEAGTAGFRAASDIPIGAPWNPEHLPGVPAIVVEPESFGAAYQIRSQWRADARTMAVFPAEVLVRLYNVLGDVRDLLAVISVLTQVLVIGAVLLAVLASLAQRRRMIGILRALGASRAFVFASIWANVALLLIAGSLLGLLVGWLGAFAVSSLFQARTDVALPVSLTLAELRLVATVVLIGLILATIPAALSYRRPIAEALRG